MRATGSCRAATKRLGRLMLTPHPLSICLCLYAEYAARTRTSKRRCRSQDTATGQAISSWHGFAPSPVLSSLLCVCLFVSILFSSPSSSTRQRAQCRTASFSPPPRVISDRRKRKRKERKHTPSLRSVGTRCRPCLSACLPQCSADPSLLPSTATWRLSAAFPRHPPSTALHRRSPTCEESTTHASPPVSIRNGSLARKPSPLADSISYVVLTSRPTHRALCVGRQGCGGTHTPDHARTSYH